jgi:hypothetical protein
VGLKIRVLRSAREYLYELPSLPPHPWRTHDAHGHYPALLDGHPGSRINLLIELLFLGVIGCRTGVGDDRFCNVVEGAKELILF